MSRIIDQVAGWLWAACAAIGGVTLAFGVVLVAATNTSATNTDTLKTIVSVTATISALCAVLALAASALAAVAAPTARRHH